MTMRLIALLAVACLAAVTQAQTEDERILNYHSRIEIQADASVIVNETITVRSLQRQIRRGIYRDFP
ncbi:MAG: DUF2207 domain-containing protein, partial [Xanthomonadaceae bacterium]|nr:DUF2207 domain-containing protein [Xanthomonadaceae bacterium]